MEFVHEFSLSARLSAPVRVGPTPIGRRAYFGVSGGEISGSRLNGKLLSGGEWALDPGDGHIRVDVRIQIETSDGACIYGQYFGLLEQNQAVQDAIVGGKGTAFGDQLFYTNPRFETGDPRYAWLNTTFFVAQGRMLEGGGVFYNIYRPKTDF